MTLNEIMRDIGNSIIRMTDSKIAKVLEEITDKINSEANGGTIGGEPITLENYYTKAQINNLIPKKTSDLDNDSNFISSYTETDPVYLADKPNIAFKTDLPTKTSQLTNDSGFISSYTETDPVYLADKPNIALKSEIPTNNNQLTNGAGYATVTYVNNSLGDISTLLNTINGEAI